MTDRSLVETDGDSADLDEILGPHRRRRRWLHWSAIGVALVVIVGWAVVAARGLERDPTVVDSPLIGKPAPTFQLPGLDADEVASGDYTGRIYVVNFWASWCVPCREEAPRLQRFWQRYGPDVGLIGIVYQDTDAKARDFRDEFGLTFPQAMDPGGRTALDFGVFGIPETFVVDERGVVKAKLIGAVGPDTLDRVLPEVRSGDTYSSRNDDYRTGPDAG
jgi:cytochrome c biogenesis protein CcmG, thiol:disulfide interchange protein DsbE